MSHPSSPGQNEANPSGSGEQTTTPLSESKDGGKSTGDELEVTSDGTEGKKRRTKRRSSKASTIKGGGRPSSAASSRQPIQKVVYYQNRFITVSIDPATGKVVETGGPVLNAVGPGGTDSVTGRGEPGDGSGIGGGPGHRNTSSNKGRGTQGAGGKMSAIEIDTMQQDPYPGGSGGIAGRPSGNMGSNQAGKAGKFGQFKVPSCLKTCHKYLQDNRLETGSASTKEELKDNNKTQDQTNMCLKKVLNIIFVTTGVSPVF